MSQLVVATLIVVSVPAFAFAQRGGGRRGGGGGGGRVVVSRPVVVSPFFSPFYRYGGYYSPFFMDFYGWGFPSFYAPVFYNRGFMPESSARIQVTPRNAEVYVDGYLAGVVDDFDGFAQRLRVAPGQHTIELYLDGHKTITQSILFQPGETYRMKQAMEPLAAGEMSPERPKPQPGAQPQQAPFDAFGRAPQGRPSAGVGSTLAIRVQPGDASVVIDGERWQTSGTDRLDVQVTPGEHRVEISKDGYQPFSTTVRVAAGATSPLNVSLTKSE